MLVFVLLLSDRIRVGAGKGLATLNFVSRGIGERGPSDLHQ